MPQSDDLRYPRLRPLARIAVNSLCLLLLPIATRSTVRASSLPPSTASRRPRHSTLDGHCCHADAPSSLLAMRWPPTAAGNVARPPTVIGQASLAERPLAIASRVSLAAIGPCLKPSARVTSSSLPGRSSVGGPESNHRGQIQALSSPCGLLPRRMPLLCLRRHLWNHRVARGCQIRPRRPRPHRHHLLCGLLHRCSRWLRGRRPRVGQHRHRAGTDPSR